jgi:adenosine deaminase
VSGTRDAELRALPKVELHRHLDGSPRVGTILELARENGIELGARTVEELAAKLTVTSPLRDLETVLRAFGTFQRVLCSVEAISRVTFENVEDAWRDGVKLVELRFAPAFIAGGKPLPHDEIISAVLDGASRGAREFPVEVGLIGILARGQPFAENEKAARALVRWKEGGAAGSERLCGLDLADGEDACDPRDFLPLVDAARAAGLGITIHSGENTTSRHVRRTLEVFRPARIGHGIRAWGDDELLERLREEDVLLEVCPTSNWLTSSVPDLRAHPLPLLRRAGVPVSINSDDPNLFGIDLVNEYRVCAELYGFGAEDFREMNTKALAHSFLPEPAREKVRGLYFAD